MTDQELFDKVATHLLTQNARSTRYYSNNACAYRGKNGTSCAIGCLIPDEKYSPVFEGITLSEDKGELRGAAGISFEQKGLAIKLQHIHDLEPVPHWKSELRQVAKDFNLSDKVVS